MTAFPSPNGSLNLPEPLEEFDGELRQPLFVIPEDSDHDFRWRLKIDEAVAAIAVASVAEREEVRDLLWDFCYRQTRKWSWLKEKSWTTASLRLFLEFQSCWQGNPEWWEASFYNGHTGVWRIQWSRYNLSLDDCYILIQQRIDCPPDQVIEPEWFDDWQQYGLWLRGFHSFADYALFRSKLGEGDPWQQRIDWRIYTETDTTDAEGSNGDNWGVAGTEDIPVDGHKDRANGHCALENWFIQQVWYDPTEWHDNLGWT